MAGSTLSRRVSEFFGVALFAAALIWLIALATYEPTDPGVVLQRRLECAAGEFRRPRRRVSRRAVVPVARATRRISSRRPWSSSAGTTSGAATLDAQYTKLVGAGLLFGCVSSLLSLAFGSVDVAGKPFRAGGYLGEWLAAWMAEYLNRTGSIIVILTLLFLAIVLSTQFSLGQDVLVGNEGRPVAAARGCLARSEAGSTSDAAPDSGRRCWPNRRRRPKAAPVVAAPRKPVETAPARAAASIEDETPRGGTAAACDGKRPKTLENPPLPLPDPEPRQPRRNGAFTIPPLSLLDAPKTERKIDERELMEGARLLEEKCREFAVEGAVAQIHPGPVVTTFEFKPDAGVKYGKITEPGRRPVSGDAGRIGADRSHSRQVDRRHSDSRITPASRFRCASCCSRRCISARARS